MIKLEDITDKVKITNKLGAELIVELVTDEGVYTSIWNAPLKKFDRLYRPKEVVKEQVNKGEWLLIDGRLPFTKEALLKYIEGHYGQPTVIMDFIKTEDMLDDSIIVSKGLTKGAGIFYKGCPHKFQFEKYDAKTNETVLYIKDVDIYISVPDELLSNRTLNGFNTVSLDDVAKKIFSLKDASFLFITDL